MYQRNHEQVLYNKAFRSNPPSLVNQRDLPCEELLCDGKHATFVWVYQVSPLMIIFGRHVPSRKWLGGGGAAKRGEEEKGSCASHGTGRGLGRQGVDA